jgi:hypothetical protein
MVTVGTNFYPKKGTDLALWMCHLKLPDTPAYDSLLKKPCTDVRCRYVGRTFVKVAGKPTDILEKLNEMAGFTPNEEIQLYEVWFLRSSNSSMNVLLSFLGIIFQEFFVRNCFSFCAGNQV